MPRGIPDSVRPVPGGLCRGSQPSGEIGVKGAYRPEQRAPQPALPVYGEPLGGWFLIGAATTEGQQYCNPIAHGGVITSALRDDVLSQTVCVADGERAQKRSDAAICHPRFGCVQGTTEVQGSQKEYRFRPHRMDGYAFLIGTLHRIRRTDKDAGWPRPGTRPPDTLMPRGAGSHRRRAIVGATKCRTNGSSWWIGIRAEALNGTARLRRPV